MNRRPERRDRDDADLVPVSVVDVGSAAYWPDSEDPADPTGARSAAVPVRSATVVVAVVVALLLAVVAVGSWHYRARRVTTTRTVVPPATATVDAAGCPVNRDCLLDSFPDARLIDAVQRQVSQAVVLTGDATTDPTGQRVYRTSLLVRTPAGVTVSVVSDCVPGGDPVPDRSRLTSNSGTAAGAGAAVVELVVGGAAGCSVAVVAEVPHGVPIPDAGLTALANDPSVQLTLPPG